MTAPILELSHCCCGRIEKFSSLKRIGVLALDTLLSITSLIVGILGVTAVIAMPPAAAYSLIGISAGITLLYIAAIIKRCTCQSKATT